MIKALRKSKNIKVNRSAPLLDEFINQGLITYVDMSNYSQEIIDGGVKRINRIKKDKSSR